MSTTKWRVLRGASWVNNPQFARSANRIRGGSTYRNPNYGFRLVEGIEPKYRVLRGGSWGNDPVSLRAENRNRNTPGNRSGDVGFRLVEDA
jgi:formylglycine-generating enzyme required for sulfatase activity